MEVLINGVRFVQQIEKNTDKVKFDVLITSARKIKNETLEEASHNMGISKSHLWSMEKGETEPKLRMIQKILLYYSIEFEEISND